MLVEKGVLSREKARELREIAANATNETAHILGGFRLGREIAAGGMGVVYRGHQLALDRQVAVKVLSDRFAADAEFVKRLSMEAKAVAKLDHPNIVRAIDFGEADGKYYFAMEFVDGESLADILDRRVKIPEAEALGIAIQVARGMQCAWENDIVHRDIKPGNILMTRNGTAKIADLGLVREVGAADSTSLTQVGTVLGTPDYLAPEQAEGGPIDVRTDIYAFGITLYEMVTGELPFNGEDAWSVIKARFKTRPQPVYAMTPGVSEEFSGIIETMMALAPDHRYPDPTVLLDDLISVAEGGVPRYAVSLGSSRGKVAEDARTRQSQVMSGPVPVVLRKRRRRRLLVGGGAAGGAAVLILLTVVLFAGGTRTDPLEDEAKAFFDGMVGMFSEGDYARVVQEADEAGTKYVGTPLWGDIARLRIDAEREVVKGKLFADLVRQARSGISSGDHDGALRLLTEAIKLRRTAEVEELMEGTRRLAKEKRHKELLRLARTAMKGGDYETARQHLGDAKRL
ncbi:MAG: serine/threonine-protein kinase, partial [Planctomycetota bacterium]